MGHVNEGGMHFIYHGKGIEKKEFEFDNSYSSKSKKKSTDRPKTIIYKGEVCEVVSVKGVKNSTQISLRKINQYKCAIGYTLFSDKTSGEYICILLMHKISAGFKLDSFERYVLTASHAFTTVDVMVEVAINKDHKTPIRCFTDNLFIKIDKDACWVAACIPLSKAKGPIKNEKNRYKIDFSVSIDSGLEVRSQLSLTEEELNTTLYKKDNPLKKIRNRDVKNLFSFSGFEYYCEEY